VVVVFGRTRVGKWLGRSVFVVEKVSGVMLALFGLLLPFT
jgi:hypothetical protein